jgi:hypothetical protein
LERAPHVHARKMIWNAHLMYTREKSLSAQW